MKKIIHFHFDLRPNIGDAAVVYAIKDILESNFTISTYTSRPIFYLTDTDFHNFFSTKLQSSNRIFQNPTIKKLSIKALVSMMKLAKMSKRSDKKSIVKSINKHDLMIVGGGGIYSKWTLPFDTDLLAQIKIPIIIWGSGYNHNFTDKELSNKDLESIRQLTTKAKLTSVRDQKTYELVTSLIKKDVLLTGDPAIFLKSNKIDIEFPRASIKIGLNIASHEKHVKDSVEKIISFYVKLVKDLQKIFKVEVYYLKHSKDEATVATKLQEMFPEIIVCEYGPREMKYVYEHLDFVICMMLHSSIFAYGSDVPFINIAYDTKNHAFMKLINNEKNLIDIRDLHYKQLYEKTVSLLQNKKTYYKNVVKKEVFQKKIQKFVENITLLD